jgi:chromosome segregation ATPase
MNENGPEQIDFLEAHIDSLKADLEAARVEIKKYHTANGAIEKQWEEAVKELGDIKAKLARAVEAGTRVRDEACICCTETDDGCNKCQMTRLTLAWDAAIKDASEARR